MDETTNAEPHYRRPDWFTRRVLAPVMNSLMRLGISVWGSRILEHRGRRTGAVHRVPVNLLRFDSHEYLVAARGETEWVRNVRAADGRLTLVLGRHRDERRAVEVPDEERVPVLRAYLVRWKFEVGMFFEGVGPDSSDAELLAVAARHPVFRVG